MTKRKVPECAVEITKTDMYVVFDGGRIAERGKFRAPPVVGASHRAPRLGPAATWIPLDPRYEVYDAPDLSEIVVVVKKPDLKFHA
jgi:hypothetical protein